MLRLIRLLTLVALIPSLSLAGIKLIPAYDSDAAIDYTVVSNIVDTATASPWIDWTATITPANGTATVSRATGSHPMLLLTGNTVLAVPITDWPTTGVSRVSLSLWAGTNAVSLLTNTVNYTTTPTISTNDWTTILFRRVGNQSKWKGVAL